MKFNPSSYGELPERFFARVNPTPVAKPRLIAFNHALADELGLDVEGLGAQELAALFSGNLLAPGSQPIAMAYAGHQFGHFVPQLGDGRAILLGEGGFSSSAQRDIQLKGAGRTPYSRGGDGRAALGPVLREYLVSEAMRALGIPATRALAAVATGESVYREEALPGAILTRVAASHVRVGTFQYFAARGDDDACRELADYVIDRHYPEAKREGLPYLAMLRAVTEAQASLVARWMNVGFIHGVMNTDNMAVSGETIDFGPCAFMDDYDSAKVFSSIDSQGRYAYANQPHAAAWNLARLAETLLPLIDPRPERAAELATEVISTFAPRFSGHWLSGLRRKLGLATCEESDNALAEDLLDIMQRSHADFTVTFRALCHAAASPEQDSTMHALFTDPQAYEEWAARWRKRLEREPLEPHLRAQSMQAVNPAFIPRNHRIEEVIVAAVQAEDFGPFEKLSDVLSQPYSTRVAVAEYADPPRPAERVRQTFCGT
ncbi:MAG: YdiU family protein [Pseudomonadota bacterium]|nr:YdiU family protein [Pseudomonadota bacterium]